MSAIKAYKNPEFLAGREARSLRILAEYIEPLERFRRYHVQDTIVFFGSARTLSRKDALANLEAARAAGDDDAVAGAERDVTMSRYYEDARSLAGKLTAYHLDAENVVNMVAATRMEIQPNDVIFVAEQPITAWNRVISQILPQIFLQAANIANNN